MFIRFNGFQAGAGGPLHVVDMPSPEDDIETSRTDVLGGDGQVAGPDYVRKAIWNITLLVNTWTYEDGKALVNKVRNAWLDPKVRLTGTPSPLEYSKDGVTWYRVYGRPIKYGGPPQGTELDQGIAYLELQFEQTKTTHYAVSESTTRLGAVPARASRGWTTPFMFPLVTGHLSEPVDSTLHNEGDVDSPLLVTFGGVMSEPRLSNFQDDIVIGVSGDLRWDDRITIDAFNETVYHWRVVNPGVRTPVPGRLIRQSRLSRLKASPGETDWQLRYTSADGGFAEMAINSAFASMQ